MWSRDQNGIAWTDHGHGGETDDRVSIEYLLGEARGDDSSLRRLREAFGVLEPMDERVVGREEATAEIVAWLRDPDGAKVAQSGIGTAYAIADQLERGEHVKKEDRQ